MTSLSKWIERIESHVFAPSGRAWPIEAARRAVSVVWLAGRGFYHREGYRYAAALAFDSVLALVPFIALVLASLRAFGGYEAFLESTVTPWIESTFEPSPENLVTMREAMFSIVGLAQQTDMRALGIFGVGALLYLVIVLLVSMETTFNRVWGVRKPRPLLRRMADFAAILFIVPLCLLLATRLGGLGGGSGPLGTLSAVLAAIAVLAFTYAVMPSTRVRLSSALLGGAVAGISWHIVLVAYAAFQVGVARYNLVYSSLAILPLFLIWVFASWMVILFGAELAAAHQNPRAFRWRVRSGEVSAATRRRLGARFLIELGRVFVDGKRPRPLAGLAAEVGIPTRLAEAILIDLCRAGLVAEATDDEGATYLLACDPRELPLADILAALEQTPDPRELGVITEDEIQGAADAWLAAFEASASVNGGGLTLRDVVDRLRPAPETPQTAEASAGEDP